MLGVFLFPFLLLAAAAAGYWLAFLVGVLVLIPRGLVPTFAAPGHGRPVTCELTVSTGWDQEERAASTLNSRRGIDVAPIRQCCRPKVTP